MQKKKIRVGKKKKICTLMEKNQQVKNTMEKEKEGEREFFNPQFLIHTTLSFHYTNHSKNISKNNSIKKKKIKYRKYYIHPHIISL